MLQQPPLASESDITVNYPTSMDDYVYIENKDNYFNLSAAEISECDKMVKFGVFDPVCYIQLNDDLITGNYASKTETQLRITLIICIGTG